MGTRCLLALLSIVFMLLAPVTSFPTGSGEQSRDNVGVAAFLRMLKSQILNRSRGTGLRGAQSRGVKVHQDDSPKVNSLDNGVVPVWPQRLNVEGWDLGGDVAPQVDETNLANDSDRDFPADLTAGVDGFEDDKRDYGHGFFFGKRVPSEKVVNRHQDETTMHRERRPEDYNWGMWFGKRGRSKAYDWGGFFGKRSGDIIEYDDFVA